MMQYREFEAVEGIPSGLCACILGNEPLHIAALSPKCIWLRTPKPIVPGAPLRLYFYQPQRGDYEIHTLNNYEAGSAQRKNGAVLTRLCFHDSACAAAIRRMFNDYARYLEIKSTDGPAAYAAYLNDYPAELEESFPRDLQTQRGQWFSTLAPLPELSENVSFAVELNCPELWKLYLALPMHAFMDAYARARNIPFGWLPGRIPDRIYIGNACCRHLFPREAELNRIAEKAMREGLKITLVSAELRTDGQHEADFQRARAASLGAELVINDWGMLERAINDPNRPDILLGTQLNRRRKDPRMAYKSGLKGKESLLAQNSINDDGWRSFLAEFGVVRYEYESCILPTQLPPGKCSLHFPFYQTNTALWCPLQALMEHSSRGAQTGAAHCRQWCNDHALIYPVHLKMLGRWNSIFALDSAPDFSPAYDRWVLNF